MPRQTRQKTRYSGVFVVDLSSGDQTFYIRFKKDGKLIEERAGRKILYLMLFTNIDGGSYSIYSGL